MHFEQEEKQQFRSKVPANVRVSNVISKHLVFRLAEFNMRQQQARGDEKTDREWRLLWTQWWPLIWQPSARTTQLIWISLICRGFRHESLCPEMTELQRFVFKFYKNDSQFFSYCMSSKSIPDPLHSSSIHFGPWSLTWKPAILKSVQWKSAISALDIKRTSLSLSVVL